MLLNQGRLLTLVYAEQKMVKKEKHKVEVKKGVNIGVDDLESLKMDLQIKMKKFKVEGVMLPASTIREAVSSVNLQVLDVDLVERLIFIMPGHIEEKAAKTEQSAQVLEQTIASLELHDANDPSRRSVAWPGLFQNALI